MATTTTTTSLLLRRVGGVWRAYLPELVFSTNENLIQTRCLCSGASTSTSVPSQPPSGSTTNRTTASSSKNKPTTDKNPNNTSGDSKSRWEWWKRILQIGGFGLLTGYFGSLYYHDHTFIPRSFRNVTKELEGLITYLKKPSRKKLLPESDDVRLGLPPRKTLLLEIQGVLGRTEYSRQNGWRFYKRPGASAFIAHLENKYELVLFTTESIFDIEWAIEELEGNDAMGLIFRYRLYRGETNYIHGKYVKDLTFLNRSLNKVICIDWNDDVLLYQPENLLQVSKWNGNQDDRELLDLIPLLEEISKDDINSDVRQVLNDVKIHGVEKTTDVYKKKMAMLRERSAGVFGVFGMPQQEAQQQGLGLGQEQSTAPQGGGTALGRLIGLGGAGRGAG